MPTVSLTCTHTTVLLQEAVDALVHDPQGSYLDATFGRGGHSRAILARMGPNARLCAFDQDPQAVQSAQDLLQDPRFSVRHVPFSSLRDWPAASLSGVLLDIGVSSPQIDQAERGFSFRHDGPLDMRMDPTRGRSVHQWLVTASQEEIAGVIRDHGEERFAVQIAKAIVARREERGAPASTAELAQLVAGTVKTREPGQDPATRTFQAFRIHINAELEELQQALEASIHALQPGGRLVVISFHSLEDRIVIGLMLGVRLMSRARVVGFVARRTARLMLRTSSLAALLLMLGSTPTQSANCVENVTSITTVIGSTCCRT